MRYQHPRRDGIASCIFSLIYLPVLSLLVICAVFNILYFLPTINLLTHGTDFMDFMISFHDFMDFMTIFLSYSAFGVNFAFFNIHFSYIIFTTLHGNVQVFKRHLKASVKHIAVLKSVADCS